MSVTTSLICSLLLLFGSVYAINWSSIPSKTEPGSNYIASLEEEWDLCAKEQAAMVMVCIRGPKRPAVSEVELRLELPDYSLTSTVKLHYQSGSDSKLVCGSLTPCDLWDNMVSRYEKRTDQSSPLCSKRGPVKMIVPVPKSLQEAVVVEIRVSGGKISRSEEPINLFQSASVFVPEGVYSSGCKTLRIVGSYVNGWPLYRREKPAVNPSPPVCHMGSGDIEGYVFYIFSADPFRNGDVRCESPVEGQSPDSKEDGKPMEEDGKPMEEDGKPMEEDSSPTTADPGITNALTTATVTSGASEVVGATVRRGVLFVIVAVYLSRL